MRSEQSQVFLNGEFLALDQAKISVMDRGFLFGDGVYEVIPCYNGRLFRLSEHLRRLNDSLRGIGMDNPKPVADWRRILETLTAQWPNSDQAVYLQVTRGAYAERNHAVPENVEATLFAMANPLPPADPQLVASGIDAYTIEDIRWQLCNIKAITLLANILMREEAARQGGREAILIRDGRVTEGATSNLFIVLDDTIVTPPKSHLLLPGVTRDLVLELSAKADLPCREGDITEAQLAAANEIWVTSSTKELVAVTRLNGQTVGTGLPGPCYGKIAGLYADYKAQVSGGLEA